MKITFFHNAAIILLVICSTKSYTQLIIETSVSPEDMVQNICDESISFFDVTYYGDSLSSGTFSTNGITNLGMNEGVLFTSGRAMLALGPNNNGNIGYVNTLPGHPLLDEVYNAPSGDVCGISFSFTASNDLLLCEVIFGSEEYPEALLYWYEGFGFFISGPRPGGNYYADTNIANVPTTTLPINVHNINNVLPSYPQYYVDNTNGQYIQYDGFTVSIVLYCNLIPDSTYTVHVLIGDYGDRYYDSGLFIETNGFRSISSIDSLGFRFKAENNPELNDDFAGIVTEDSVLVSLPYGTDLTSLIASFSVYPGVLVYIDSVLQISDVTINDFSVPLIYSVVSPNGISKDRTVVVDYLPNTEHELFIYAFLTNYNPNLSDNLIGVFNGQIVTVEAPIGTDVSNLIATFYLSDNAIAIVNGVVQQKNVTPNDFSEPILYVIQAENGDTSHYIVKVNLKTSESEYLNQSEIEMFPNPATDQIIVAINYELNEESFVRIFDINGQQVIHHNFQNQKLIEIDVSALPEGIYLVKIQTKEGMEVKKVLIQ